jgi:hypothetical protein
MTTITKKMSAELCACAPTPHNVRPPRRTSTFIIINSNVGKKEG